MSIYGYIGTITEENNKDQQQEALKEYAINNNVKFTTVFEDKLCKKSFGRPNYMALKQILRRGDIVIIKEAKRLGRNYREIQEELKGFQVRGIKLLILDMLVLKGIQDEILDTELQNQIINIVKYIA